MSNLSHFSLGLWGVAEIQGGQRLAPVGLAVGSRGCRFWWHIASTESKELASRSHGLDQVGEGKVWGPQGCPPALCWAVSQPQEHPAAKPAAPSPDSISTATKSLPRDLGLALNGDLHGCHRRKFS